MAFDLPRDVVFPVEAVAVRLLPGPHPYETANLPAIDANWAAESAANPALFDGRITLLSALAYRGRQLVGTCHLVRFATFLHWRKNRAVEGAEHCFAQAVPVAADNHLIAARMGGQTLNAGRVYFPAGSFEAEDFSSDGLVDADGNMAREVFEETGIKLRDLRRDALFHALSTEAGTVIFRRYYLDDPAEAVAAKVRDFIAADPHAELAEPVIIRSAADRPAGLAAYIPDVLHWHFGAGALPSPPVGEGGRAAQRS
jgi:8-oxo-dGTP pyrophosphatase MutT (NUDIX family)